MKGGEPGSPVSKRPWALLSSTAQGPQGHRPSAWLYVASMQHSFWGCDDNELTLTLLLRKTNRGSLRVNTPSPPHMQKSGCDSAV